MILGTVCLSLLIHTTFAQTNLCANLFGADHACNNDFFSINPDPFAMTDRVTFTGTPSYYAIKIPFPSGRITNFLLSSSSTLTCGQLVFCINSPDVSAVNCKSSGSLIQNTAHVCTVPMSGVFFDSAEAAKAEADNNMQIVIGSKDAVGVTLSIDVYQDFLTPITYFGTSVSPDYFVDTFNANINEANKDEVLLTETFHLDRCDLTPSSARLVFKPSDALCDVPFNVVVTDSSFTAKITREFIIRCSDSNSVNADDATKKDYNMKAIPYILNSNCVDSNTTTGVQSGLVIPFKVIMDGTTISGTKNDVLIPGINPQGATYNYIRADECEGRISIMDKIRVEQIVQFSWVTLMGMNKAFSLNAVLGDIPLSRTDTDITCDAIKVSGLYSFQQCFVKYTSDECLPMVATTSGSCVFDMNFGLFTGMTVTMSFDTVEASTTTTVITNAKPALDGPCNEPLPIVDVTAVTPSVIQPSTTGDLNVIQVLMDTTSWSSSVTMAIAQVRISAIDADGNEFIRTFDVWEKIRQMQVSNSPYYSDVHHCRYIDRSSVQAADVCELPFYNRLKDGSMHDPYSNFAIVLPLNTIVNNQVTNTPPFLLDYRGHELCQDVRVRNEDRWAFNPSLWTFRNMKRSDVTYATVRITSVLSSCATPSGYDPNVRRLRSMTEENNETTKVIRHTIDLELNFGETNDVPKPPPETTKATENISIALIVICSVLSVVILAVSGYVFFLYRRKMQEKKKAEQQVPNNNICK